MIGAGKYDDLCTQVRAATDAELAAVIVINGTRGAGFSVQGTLEAHAVLADMLEHVARTIRADLAALEASRTKQ